MIPFSSLFYFFEDGCEACAAAEPELDEWIRAHPAAQVLKLQAGGPFAGILGRRVRATPTYLLRYGARGAVHEGALSAGELETWINEATAELRG